MNFSRTTAVSKNQEIGRAVRTRAFERKTQVSRTKPIINLIVQKSLSDASGHSSSNTKPLPTQTSNGTATTIKLYSMEAVPVENFAELFWFPLDVIRVTHINSLFSSKNWLYSSTPLNRRSSKRTNPNRGSTRFRGFYH